MRFSLTFALGLLFLFLSYSCSEDDGGNEPFEEQTCTILSEYYFSGYINDTLYCFNEGIDNYQRYSGSTFYYEDTINAKFTIGIDTYPLSVDDKHIYLRTPLVDSYDLDKISDLFPIRKLTSDEIKLFELNYNIIVNADKKNTFERERFKCNFDDESSSIEVIDFKNVYIPNLHSGTIFKVKLLINCTFYDSLGNIKSELVSGEMTGLIFVNDVQ